MPKMAPVPSEAEAVLGAGLEPDSLRGKSRVRWHGAVKTFVKQDVVIARIPL
jgi:hypothetical protein